MRVSAFESVKGPPEKLNQRTLPKPGLRAHTSSFLMTLYIIFLINVDVKEGKQYVIINGSSVP